MQEDQVPWFATSNGVIDLHTSADFRDHRYTNNQIEPKNEDPRTDDQKLEKADSASSGKKHKSLKVVAGGLPPLANNQRRPSPSARSLNSAISGPPPPKDNELYGDILVIPPIKPRPLDEQYFPTYSRFDQVTQKTFYLILITSTPNT